MPSQRKNDIVHFYAVSHRGIPQVFTSSLPMSPQTALESINRERQRATAAGKPAEPVLSGYMLWVALDQSSRRMYLPMADDLKQEGIAPLFQAIRLDIERRWGGTAAAAPIPGDPLQTLRLRTVADFPGAWDFVQRFAGKDAKNLPVVEADLSSMPAVAGDLGMAGLVCPNADCAAHGSKLANLGELDRCPKCDERLTPFHRPCLYVGVSAAPVAFEMSRGGSAPLMLHVQKPPFILINLSQEAQMTPSRKEAAMLTAWREGYGQERGESSLGQMTGSEHFAVEILIYTGWPMEHLCHALLAKRRLDAKTIVSAGAHIVFAAKRMASLGYHDVSTPPFYYAYRTNDKYPEALILANPMVIQQLWRDPSGWVVLRTPLFLTNQMLQNEFGANERRPIVRGRYEPSRHSFAFESEFDELTTEAPEAFRRLCAAGLSDAWGSAHGQAGASHKGYSVEIKSPNARLFRRSRISCYPQTEDALMKACDQLSRSMGQDVKFDDLEVIVGPWQKLVNMAGGYLDPDKLRKGGVAFPWEPIPGMSLYPPVILVDEDTSPTAADQANVLVHEYWHYIYYQKLQRKEAGWICENPNCKYRGLTEVPAACPRCGGRVKYEPYDPPTQYNSPENMVRWRRYLRTPTEEMSHVQQFKYLLSTGLTKSEIIMFLFGGRMPGVDGLARARQYAEYIDEAARLLDAESRDEPFGGAHDTATNVG